MSSLFVSSGRKKLKLHDSAVMFEQRVWFSVLIMLPQANLPLYRNNHPLPHSLRWLSSWQSHKQTQAETWVLKHTYTHRHVRGWTDTKADVHTGNIHRTHTCTHPPSFSSKWFICSDLGEMIPCNETDREDDFFIHLGTKRAVALLFMVDSLYKHRQWVWSFPITPSHPLIISTLESARSDRRST